MVSRRSEILVFHGATDGSNATGTFTLSSPDVDGTVTQVQLDRGLKAKIWVELVSGSPVTVKVMGSPDGSTWSELARLDLVSPGFLGVDTRRPILVRFRTGSEAVRFDWSQSTAAESHITVVMEVEEDD